MPHLILPQELEKLREKIEATVKPTIKINAKGGATALHQSKFAGFPYLPKTAQLPKDASGVPMKLLAQINFEELPESLADFPEKGILQFFLSAEDDVMGLDFDDQTNQSNFKVVYHEELVPEDQLVTDFSFLEEPVEDNCPAKKEPSLSFQLAEEAVSAADRNFEKAFQGIDFEEVIKVVENEEFMLWRVYAEQFPCDGHKIGGYPFFPHVGIPAK